MEKHNYLCGALVERAYAEAGARHPKAKEADRAARRELHRVAGAFFSREEAKRAEKLLAAWPEGGDAALEYLGEINRRLAAEKGLDFVNLHAPFRLLNAACTLIGPDRVLVLVNAHGDRTWIPPTNQVLAHYAAAHPDNVVLVDWDATANANAQVLGSDGIHPSMDSDIYAKAVKQAIEQWIASGR